VPGIEKTSGDPSYLCSSRRSCRRTTSHLKTQARVPYFAYTSVLHLRETLGDREGRERLATHYAEADNELHHLLIMEELGGDASPVDRVVAQALACALFWYAAGAYFAAPRFAYHLSELIEAHAYETYDAYLRSHEAELRRQPVPRAARAYYDAPNPYLFDLCRTTTSGRRRVPLKKSKLASLYDVFVNVRDDEKTHWATLCSLVQFDSLSEPPGSSPLEATRPDGP